MTDDSLLVVSQTFPPEKGGNASRIHDLTKHLTDQWDVTVVSPPPCYPHGEFDQSWKWHSRRTVNDVTVHRLWAWQPTSADPSFLSRTTYYLTFAVHVFLWLLLNIWEHDIIVSSSPPIFTGFPVYPFAVLSTIPWVVDIRDLWISVSTNLGFISKGGFIERVSKEYQRQELQTASLISVTTRKTEEELREQYRITTSIVTVPNGVEVNRFEQPRERTEPVVVYTGNLGHAQDLESCIRAMQYIDAEDMTLRIVGDGDLRDNLEELVTELGINNRVEFTGFVDRAEIPHMLSSAMIGIAPIKSDSSLQYAIPTKLYEYMASGLAVVAVGTGEIEQFVSDADAGYVADNDPRDIASKIDSLFINSTKRNQFGTNGYLYVREQYDRKAIAAQFNEHLRDHLRSQTEQDDQ